MRKAKFHIESLGETSFDGYTSGEEWNGWQCPYFEEAEKIMNLHNSDRVAAWFDAENDQFILTLKTAKNIIKVLREMAKSCTLSATATGSGRKRTAIKLLKT